MAAKRNARDVTPSPPVNKSSGTSTPTTPAPVVKSATSKSKDANLSAQEVAVAMWDNYVKVTPQRTKLIDVFMTFLVVVGVLQFVYCVIVGNYPFNAFLSGFSATVGQFVLTASLRIQTNAENKAEFENISPERAFADYVFGSLILHFFCVNFIN
ncbi:hypothetical protein VE03_03746 [Pseudogymnoascus sp. 23342-1-I1]|nr:hypothetical protein VE03_03746 [Pseudogymnoascus sp. 23342-1-I1]